MKLPVKTRLSQFSTSLWGPLSAAHVALIKLHISIALWAIKLLKKRGGDKIIFVSKWSDLHLRHAMRSALDSKHSEFQEWELCVFKWVPAWSFGTIGCTRCSWWTSWRAASSSLSRTHSLQAFVHVCVSWKSKVYEVKTKGALSDGSFTHSPQLF